MSLKIVQSAMSISLASLSQREKLVMDFVSIAQEIDIMIETASVAGFISQMNAEVVKRELRGIVAFVEEKHDAHYSTSSKLMLTSGYFKAEDGRPHLISHTAHVPKIEKKETEEPSDRRKKVLDIGRTMKVFSIKDITSHIANCSEKTIQRLLIDMVAEGLLSKEGERRWSKYKIASHK
jgi:hemerythrin